MKDIRATDSPRHQCAHWWHPLTSAGGKGGCAASPANSNLSFLRLKQIREYLISRILYLLNIFPRISLRRR